MFKIDDIISRGDIPYGTELELDCKEIGKEAFADREDLRSVTLINTEVIESGAFRSCTSLHSVSLNGVSNIGEAMFWNCNKLTYASLDCKKIGKDAFHYCNALETVSLLNTEEIGENAFYGCGSLKEIKLPDTLRKINDNAFFSSGIQHLVIPPSVTEVGEDILYNDDFNCTIEVYLKNGVLPFKHKVPIAANGTLLIVRSYETNEILCQFILFGSPYDVFTEHGIDFTEYDKIFTDPDHYCGFGPTLRAAQIRLHNPVGMSGEMFDFLKDYVSENTAYDVSQKINSGRYTANEIAEYPYLDDIDNKRFLDLIDNSAQEGKTEIAETLTQIMYKRIGNIGENDLMELIDYSAQQGKTEMTAVLMQKLYERRISRRQDDI